MTKAEDASSTVENSRRLWSSIWLCLFPVFTLREWVLTTLATTFAINTAPWFLSGFAHTAFTPIWNSIALGPYRTPFSGFIWYLFRKLRRNLYYNRFRGRVAKPASMEARQEESAMKETEDRKKRDVRAVQWLVDNINGSNETQTFVLAILGSFNQE